MEQENDIAKTVSEKWFCNREEMREESWSSGQGDEVP